MPATITYASNRVTITGPYKQFTGSSTATVVTFTSGEAPAAGDVGRFVLWCRGGTTLTAQWEVRRIIAATASTVTVHDAWGATPAPGDTFRISSSMDDILTAQPTAGTKTGAATFHINGDYALADRAFLASADQAVEWSSPTTGPIFPCANNTVLQIGVLWGGEANNATETTNGSRWSMRCNAAGSAIYATFTIETSGHVWNVYGSLVDAVNTVGGWTFLRMNGPTRFIGSVFDGTVGGRFTHPASEWAQSRMSGNNDVIPAWSLGATFTRPIDLVQFYRNLAAVKNFDVFGGTFRNCTFSDSNSSVVRVDGNVGSVFNFIDCTEFSDAKISDNGSGVLNQFRSVNYTVQTTAGAAVAGAVVRVANAAGTTQGAVQTTNASGVAGEILALRRRWENASPSLTFAPFTTRIRRYGYVFQESVSTIADPVRQVVQLQSDPYTVASEATAATYTGVTVNGATKRVSFGAGTVDTFAELYDYVQWWGQQNITSEVPWQRAGALLSINSGWTVADPAIGGMTWGGGVVEWTAPGVFVGSFDGCAFDFRAVGIYDFSGAALSGTITLVNNSGGNITVRLPAGVSYVNTDPATITITAPAIYQSVTVTGLVSGSRLQIYDTANSVELANVITGTSYTWTDPAPAAAGRDIRVRIAYVSGSSAKQFIEAAIGTAGTSASTAAVSYLANQLDDAVYNANAIDGSTVTGITISDSIDRMIINIGGGSVSWPQIYAYNVYWLHTAAGIVDDGAIIVGVDTANYRVFGFKIRNSSSAPLSITGGYGVDAATGSVASIIDTAGSVGNIYQTPDHVIAYATGSGLSPAESARLMQTALETTAQAAASNAALAAALSA